MQPSAVHSLSESTAAMCLPDSSLAYERTSGCTRTGHLKNTGASSNITRPKIEHLLQTPLPAVSVYVHLGSSSNQQIKAVYCTV